MSFIIALVLGTFLPAVAYAQHHDHYKPMAPSVTVTGEGLVTMEPDLAEIEVGVVTDAKTAPLAGKENAAKLARVIAEMKKLLGPGDEVKTIGYTLSPNYRHPKEGGKPEITGYRASNIVRVRTGGLQKVGSLIDAATQSGANNIQRLSFTLKDEDAAKREALRSAAAKAKAKAEDMARALGLKIARVLSVVESEQGFQPMMRGRAEMAMQAVQTPVETGTIEVRAVVTLTAELSGQ
ncbi:MAG: SIMPL domain-containing protein [Candidatus Binatia bacterium]